ncbi:helix-turn-helix domain-containing protein [Robertmurraya sp. P23]|uniref:helix-turn-helix domain-containing protein n=1 Tax=Robertmurraya sp. P23 TaxID=3436931 RepID=UPI003D97B71D
MKTIGERINQLRRALNMNQKQFSNVINISQGTLSDIERGKFNPSIETVISISNKFNVSTDWILKGGWVGIQTINKELEYKVSEAFSDLFLPALGKICEEFDLPPEVVYPIFGKVVANVYNNNFLTNHYDLYQTFSQLGEDDKQELIEIAKVKYRIQIKNLLEKKRTNTGD